MTSTEIDTHTESFNSTEREVYRADEEGFLIDLREVAERYNVLRVGRFLPGNEYAYSAAYVLRAGEQPGEWGTHMMVRADNQLGPLRWYFTSGHYDFVNFAAAVVDLENRY